MTLYKFYADWCGQCKVLDTNLKNANIEYTPVNIEEDEELTTRYHIRTLPTLVLVSKEGEEIKRFTGIVNVDKLKEEFKSLK